MKYLPDEQVIPLTEYQCTVDAEDQRVAESDDVTRLVKRTLQPIETTTTTTILLHLNGLQVIN